MCLLLDVERLKMDSVSPESSGIGAEPLPQVKEDEALYLLCVCCIQGADSVSSKDKQITLGIVVNHTYPLLPILSH